LSIAAPDDFSSCGYETEFRDVDFDNGSLGQDAELGVQRLLGVLLDRDDWQLNGNVELQT
jgi:hypothetical protein